MNFANSENMELTQRVRTRTPAWLVWTPILVAAVSLWPTFLQLSERWNVDSSGSHGWLIGPVCLWLVWLAHHDSRNIEPRPSAVATVLLAIAVLGTLFMRSASVENLEYLGAVAVLWLAATSVLGWRWGRALLFPVGYLLFAVPAWEYLVPVLQRLTVNAVGVLVQVAHMQAHISGDFVELAAGTFHIANGCAGGHYFVTAMALAALYCHLHFHSWRPRLILVGVMVVLALAGNWIRVFMVIYAGYVTNMQHHWVTGGHYGLGWVIFGVTLIPFFLLGRRLEALDRPATPATAAAAGAGQPSEASLAASPHSAAGAMVVACALLLAPPAAVWAVNRNGAAAADPVTLPAATGGWTGPDFGPHDWQPEFAGASSSTQGAYAGPQGTVQVYLNWLPRQGRAIELIGYSAHPAGRGYEPLGSELVKLADGEWRLIEAEGRTADRRLVAVRYLVAGHYVARSAEAKLWQGLGGLAGRQGAGAMLVSAACEPDCAAARRVIDAFVTNMGAGLDEALRLAGQGTRSTRGEER